MKVKKIGKSILIFMAFFSLFILIGLSVGIYADANGFSGNVNGTLGNLTVNNGTNVSVVDSDAIGKDPELLSGRKWTILDNKLYGKLFTGADNEFEEVEENVLKVSAVEKIFSSSVVGIGYSAYLWFSSWDIDLSIDGLIYGRMATSYNGKADFTHFGLESNNPYGVAGATIYYLLRRLILSLVPVLALFMLIKQLFKNTSKGRAQVKEFIQNMLMILLLLFAMPYLINYFIYIRDGFMWVMSKGIDSMYQSMGIVKYNFGNSIVNQMLSMYLETPNLLSAFLVLAAVGAGIFFFLYYISIAALLSLGFALFPLVALWSLFNRRVLTEWLNIFLPNLLLPFVDLLIFQLPSIIYNVYVNVFGKSGGVVLTVIILVVIWKTVSIRNRWLKVFGFDGLGGPQNLGLGLLAMRMAGAFSGKSSSGKHALNGKASGAVVHDSRDGAALMREARERGSVMEAADRSMDMSAHSEAWLSKSDYSSDTDKLIGEMNDKYTPLEESVSNGHLENNGSLGLPDDYMAGDATPSMEDAVGSFDDYGVPLDEYGTGAELLTAGYEESPLDNTISSVEASQKADTPLAENDLGSSAGFTASNFGVSDMDTVRETMTPEVSPNIISAAGNFPEQAPVLHSNTITKQQIHSSSKYDADFAKGLSERDKGRYENLVRKDLYSEKIAENQSYMNQVGYGKETYMQDKQNLKDSVDKLNAPIAQVTQRMNSISDKSSPEYIQAKSDLQKLTSMQDEGKQRIAQLEKAAGYDKQNNVYRYNVADCEHREKQYAYNSALGGMSDKAYDSSDKFKYQTQVNAIKKKQMDYKNFDSKQFEGILSPQERENYYRERAMKEHETRILSAVSTVGKVAVGASVAVPAMAMMAYGGPTAMTAGAYAGYVAGNVAGNGLQRMAQSSVSMGEHATAGAPAKEPAKAPVKEPTVAPQVAQGNMPVHNSIDAIRREMQRHSDNQVNKINAVQQVREDKINQIRVNMSGRSANMEAELQNQI